MNNNPFLLNLGDTIFGFGLFPTLTFLITYLVTARRVWFRSAIGRMFVLSQGGTALVSIIVLLSLSLGADYPGRDIVRVIGYSIFVIGQIALVYTYFVERRDPQSSLPKTQMDQPLDKEKV